MAMSAEERLKRIEHLKAALAEERRKDRDEYKALWRDTQAQIQELAKRTDGVAAQVARATLDMDRLILESAARDRASHERDEVLGKRVDALVSATGEFIARFPKRDVQ